MLFNSHIPAYATCFAGKVCSPVQSTWGTSLGEDKLGATGAHRALCARCARAVKSRLFFTTGSHGSQGLEFCTLQLLMVHQGFFVLV